MPEKKQLIRPSTSTPNFISEELFYQDSEHPQDSDDYVVWNASKSQNTESIRFAALTPSTRPRPQEIPEAVQRTIRTISATLTWKPRKHNNNQFHEYRKNIYTDHRLDPQGDVLQILLIRG